MEIGKKPAFQYKQTPQSQTPGTYSARKHPRTPGKGWLDEYLKLNRNKITSSFTGRALFGDDDAMKKKLSERGAITFPLGQFSSNCVTQRKVMPQTAQSTPSKHKCPRTSKRWLNELLEANRDKIVSPLTRQVFFQNGDTVIKKSVQKKPIVIPLGKFPKNFVPMLFSKKNNLIRKREAENKTTKNKMGRKQGSKQHGKLQVFV